MAAARRVFPNLSTPDVILFEEAIQADGPERAELAWRLCLGAGDLKAHYGLGYTLRDLGRPREAHPHLCRYTQLAPWNAWAWRWLGYACEAMGELAEARRAFEHAVSLEADDDGYFETEAPERLSQLTGKDVPAETREPEGPDAGKGGRL